MPLVKTLIVALVLCATGNSMAQQTPYAGGCENGIHSAQALTDATGIDAQTILDYLGVEHWQMSFKPRDIDKVVMELVAYWLMKPYASQTMLPTIMDRSLELFPIFEKALSDEEVPLSFKYLPVVEVKLDENPRNDGDWKDLGLWQFLWDTATEMGLKAYPNEILRKPEGGKIALAKDERLNPIKATHAAVKYIKALKNELPRWEMAIPAYNAGLGKVQTQLSYLSRIPSDELAISDLYDVSTGNGNVSRLPSTTQCYVKKFLAMSFVMSYLRRNQAFCEVQYDQGRCAKWSAKWK